MQSTVKLSGQSYLYYLKNYGFFSLILLITSGIWLFNFKQPLFYTINSWHGYLPVWLWQTLNFISYSKYFILPFILLATVAIFKREMLIRTIILVLAFYVVFFLLKLAVGEARPYIVLPHDSFYWLNSYENAAKSAYKSFPSGHTGNMAVFVFALNSLFFPKNRVIKYTLITLLIITGLARVCTGWHWPVDVLASGLIGYILVKVCLSRKNESIL